MYVSTFPEAIKPFIALHEHYCVLSGNECTTNKCFIWKTIKYRTSNF